MKRKAKRASKAAGPKALIRDGGNAKALIRGVSERLPPHSLAPEAMVERIREQNRLRVQRHRQRQAERDAGRTR